MELVIGIATVGRRDQLPLTLEQLAKQTRLPDQVVICPATVNDYCNDAKTHYPFRVVTIYGEKGSSSQRNAIIEYCSNADVIAFFDDDFYPNQNYLSELETIFKDEKIVVACGALLADGISGPGISHDEAEKLNDLSLIKKPTFETITDTYGAYGCNMVVRMAPVRSHKLRFDENLPLYGWQEDIDFSRTLAPYGRIVRSNRLLGVHLAVKRGRTSGVRFGYSQIANPLYLYRKGTMSASFACRLIFRNVLANFFKWQSPEPWVDRLGRLKGNLFAIWDVLFGKLHPTNILNLE